MEPFLDRRLFERHKRKARKTYISSLFFTLALCAVSSGFLFLYVSAPDSTVVFDHTARQIETMPASAATGAAGLLRTIASWFDPINPSGQIIYVRGTTTYPISPNVSSATAARATTTIVYQTINHPVVEHVIEHTTAPPPDTSIIDQKIASLTQTLRAEFSNAPPNPPSVTVQSFAASQRIDNLANTSIQNPTISGGSISGTSISAHDLSVSGAVNFAAASLSGALSAVSAAFDSLFTHELVAINATTTNATTTNLAVIGTATSTFTGGITAARLNALSTSTLSGLVVDASGLRLSGSNCSSLGNGGKLTTDASGNVSCAADQGGSGSTVGGADTHIQFNNNGAFTGSSSFTFSSSTARLTVTNASSTALTATNLFASTVSTTNLTISALQSGLLKVGATGIVSLATGSDYQVPLTFSYPILNTGNTISLAFGTTTSNTWTGTQTFTTSTSTTANANTAVFGTATIGSLTLNSALTVPNGGTGAASLTGLVKGNGTSAFTAAVSGTDYLASGSLAATYPLQYNSGTGLFSLAFGTTTSNTWAGTQTFANSSTTLATITSLWTPSFTSTIHSTDANGKLQSTTVSSPLSFSGSTLSINNAAADGSTKGASTFTAADFNDNGAGIISLDYTNGQKATVSVPGFLASTDFTTFTNKLTALGAGWATTTGANITFSTSTLSFNGLTLGQTVAVAASTLTFTPIVTGTLNNSGLTNSTVGATSPNSTLSFGSSAALGSTFTGDLNLGHSNRWTAAQNFANASTSIFTATSSVWFTGITSSLLLNDSTGKVGAYGGASCTNQFVRSLNGAGAATCAAVQNADLANSSLTINTTYPFQGGATISLGGSATLSLAFGTTTSNTWAGTQTFGNTTNSGTLSVTGLTTLGQASTTIFSSLGPAYFGSTATSSFSTAGALTLASALTVGNGGTGVTSLTGLLQGNGTGAIAGITGTAGQFPYYNGASTLLATSSIFLATSGNVGIGTTSPFSLLSVGGNGLFTGTLQSADFITKGPYIDVRAYGAKDDGTTDNVAAFQAALSAISSAGGGTLYIPKAATGNYLFKLQGGNTPPALTVPSHTTIIVGSGVTLYSQAVFGGFNSGLFTATSGSDITITGPGSFEAASGITFTGATVSGNATISGIGSTAGLVVNMPISGAGIPDGASISSVAANSITISTTATASATVSLTAHYTGTPFIAMTGITNLKINGVQLLDTYGADVGLAFRTLIAASNFSIENVRCEYDVRTITTGRQAEAEDCIHILSPSSNGVINNIRGRSGDDFVALNVENASQSGWDSAITNIAISNIQGNSLWAQLVRLYINSTAATGTISHIQLSNISGSGNSLGTNAGSVGIVIGDDSNRSAVSDVSGSNIAVNASSTALSGIWVYNSSDVRLSNVSVTGANQNSIFAQNTTRFTLNGFQTQGQRSAGYSAVLTDASSSYSTIENGKIVSGSLLHGIEIRGTGAVVTGNTVLTGTSDGIYTSGTHGHFTNNLVSGV